MNTELYFSKVVLISSHYLYGIIRLITNISRLCIFLVGTEDRKPVLLGHLDDASLTCVHQIRTVQSIVRVREWAVESWMVFCIWHE
jgi:hypothetical protein